MITNTVKNSLKYIQSTGELFRADGSLMGIGYSGKASGKNCCAMESIKCVGPIPRGSYTAWDVHDSPPGPHSTGKLSIRLRPDAGTRNFILSLGRDPASFLMHGDNADHTASEGCIIMPRTVRAEVAAAKDAVIVVLAG